MLNVKRQIFFIVIIIFAICAGSSCALTSKYGTLQSVPAGAEMITFKKLKERFQDYHVYWSGSQETNVIAYLFDPKNDDKTINTHEWWTPVNSEKEIKDLWIFGHNVDNHIPEVYSLIGPDNEFYGYLYTSWYYVWKDISIVKAGEKTLWIDFIPVPNWGEDLWEGIGF